MRLNELLRWRSCLPILVEAVKQVLDDDVEIYVFGSAIEEETSCMIRPSG